jgi:hypothetical protein
LGRKTRRYQTWKDYKDFQKFCGETVQADGISYLISEEVRSVADIPLKEIKALAEYLYEDEANDYERTFLAPEFNLSAEALEESALSGESSDHIFVSVVKVMNWLKEAGA